MSKELENFFEGFNYIYNNRHQYRIEWAFKDAQKKIDRFNNLTIDVQLKDYCMLCKNPKNINKEYIVFKKNSKAAINRQKFYCRLFSNSYNLLTVIEFILSILLVLMVSKIRHSGDSIIESHLFSMCVVTTFAFLKVFLERNFLQPKIEQFAWEVYMRTVLVLKNITEEFDEKISRDINLELTKINYLVK